MPRLSRPLRVAPLLIVGLLCQLRSSGADEPPATPPSPCEALAHRIDQALNPPGTANVTALNEIVAATETQGCFFEKARAHNALGWHDSKEGRPFEGLGQFDLGLRALADAGSFEDPEIGAKRATLEHNRGNALMLLGLLDSARDRFQVTRALQKRFGVEKRRWADTLLGLARVQRLEGAPQEAQYSIVEAWRNDPLPGTKIALYMEQARLFAEAGRLRDAQRVLTKAMRAAEKSGSVRWQANVMSDRAELEIRKRNWERALSLANQALTLTADLSDANVLTHAHSVRSMALLALDRPEEAKQAADAGLAELETARDSWSVLSIQFIALRQEYYGHRLDLAVALDDTEDAWATVERNRDRTFGAGLGPRDQDLDSTGEGTLDDAMAARRRNLVAALQQLDFWQPGTDQTVKIFREVVLRGRRLEKLRTEQKVAAAHPMNLLPVSPKEAIELLGSDTLALTFAAGRQHVHLLNLDAHHGLAVSPLPTKRREIEGMVTDLLAKLDAGPVRRPRRLEATISELSDALLSPIADRLDDTRRLVIVADAPLARLPFELLLHPRTGQHLIMSHEISYAPSFAVLRFLQERANDCPQPANEIMVLGDPIFSAQDERWPKEKATDPRTSAEALVFNRLEASAQEAKSIAQLYSQSASLLLGEEATRARFLAGAPNYRVLHAATHARSDSDVPERSKIALSCLDHDGPVEPPCDLYLEDLAGISLCGQIVVLSACRTAEGPAVFGEGILGLPRAFLRAGASTVVASHWQVADQPTAQLMEAFHRHLRRGERPAAALRKAKIEMIKAGEPLSHWAPFVLLGDNQQIFDLNLVLGNGSHESNRRIKRIHNNSRRTNHGDGPKSHPQRR